MSSLSSRSVSTLPNDEKWPLKNASSDAGRIMSNGDGQKPTGRLGGKRATARLRDSSPGRFIK